MAIQISKYMGEVDSSIGKISILPIHIRELINISKGINDNITPSELADLFIKNNCVDESGEKLKEKNIKTLTNEDKEKILKITISKDKNVIDRVNSENIRQNKEENIVEYFHRIFKDINKVRVRLFPEYVNSKIFTTSSLAQNLSETLKQFNIPKYDIPAIKTPKYDFEERPNHLVYIKEILNKYTEFSIESYKTQIKISESIKESTDQSTLTSKKGNNLAIIILIATIISLLISVLFNIISSNLNSKLGNNIIKNTSQINETLNSIYYDNQNQFYTFENRIDSLEIKNIELEKQIEKLKNNLNNSK